MVFFIVIERKSASIIRLIPETKVAITDAWPDQFDREIQIFVIHRSVTTSELGE